MTKYKLALLPLFIILLSSCAAPLKKEMAISLISKDAKVDPAGIQDTSYCTFVVTSKTSQRGEWDECILAFNNDSIFIYVGDLNKGDIEQALKLDYANMQGVDLLKFGLGRQIHILTSTSVIGVAVNKDRAMVDQDGVDKLYTDIQNKGVPKFTSKGWIEHGAPMFIPVFMN